MAVQTQIQTRRGTAASWTSTNPTLAAGEIGFESDTNKFKIGTGSTAWASLAYASNVSPLTTKGDLYTYSTDNTRLAVGANGETIVADSSTSTGLRYTPATVVANPVLNSAYQIWQRGTSISTASAGYTADRWYTQTAANGTVSRQVTGDTTNLPSIQYCARVQRTAAATTVTDYALSQSFESINSIPFAGKTVTLSFYARKGANYSAASSILNVALATGTGTDQNLSTGYTGQAVPINSTATLTTTWQRFTYTGTIATTATEMAINYYYTSVGTAGAADYFEITGVQIDVGSVALPFRTNGGTIQGELSACQRYYYRTTQATSNLFGTGLSYNTTTALVTIPYPVTMRTRPTALEQTGTASDYKTLRATAAAFDNCTSVPTWDGSTSNAIGVISVTSANVVSGNVSLFYSNAAAAYLGWSAEL